MRKPLVSIETARAVLGKTEDQVVEMIESGALRFAWNIASKKSRSRYIRLFVPSLADAVNQKDHQPAALSDAIKFILPGSSPTVPASRLAQLFNTGSTHIADLLRERSLVKVTNGRHARSSPLVSRESVVKFLTLRRCV